MEPIGYIELKKPDNYSHIQIRTLGVHAAFLTASKIVFRLRDCILPEILNKSNLCWMLYEREVRKIVKHELMVSFNNLISNNCPYYSEDTRKAWTELVRGLVYGFYVRSLWTTYYRYVVRIDGKKYLWKIKGP